jgi:hypothetical protein
MNTINLKQWLSENCTSYKDGVWKFGYIKVTIERFVTKDFVRIKKHNKEYVREYKQEVEDEYIKTMKEIIYEKQKDVPPCPIKK